MIRIQNDAHQKFGRTLTDDEIPAIRALIASHIAMDTAIENNKKVLQDWQGIAIQGFDSVGKSIADFATGGIKTWDDFGKSLV